VTLERGQSFEDDKSDEEDGETKAVVQLVDVEANIRLHFVHDYERMIWRQISSEGETRYYSNLQLTQEVLANEEEEEEKKEEKEEEEEEKDQVPASIPLSTSAEILLVEGNEGLRGSSPKFSSSGSSSELEDLEDSDDSGESETEENGGGGFLAVFSFLLC